LARILILRLICELKVVGGAVEIEKICLHIIAGIERTDVDTEPDNHGIRTHRPYVRQRVGRGATRGTDHSSIRAGDSSGRPEQPGIYIPLLPHSGDNWTLSRVLIRLKDQRRKPGSPPVEVDNHLVRGSRLRKEQR